MIKRLYDPIINTYGTLYKLEEESFNKGSAIGELKSIVNSKVHLDNNTEWNSITVEVDSTLYGKVRFVMHAGDYVFFNERSKTIKVIHDASDELNEILDNFIDV